MKNWLLAGGIALSGLSFAHEAVEASAQEKQEKKEDEAKVEKAQEEAGGAVSQSLREAGRTIQGQRSPLAMGMTSEGEVKNTVTTDALGLLSGSGLNATLSRSLSPKWSFVGGANYSRTATTLGAATAFGLRAGADYFILGEHNEGLRIGPRVDVSFGADTLGETGGFAGVGAAGEIGYNWISSRGLTAGAGLGVHAGIGGGSANLTSLGDRIGQGNVGPYLDLNIGYSW